jgi:hypothetical protein
MLRFSILILGLITAIIHTVILNLQELNWLMLLNGLGFLVLTGAILFETDFLVKQRKLTIYLLIAYTLVTILGFFVLNSSYGPLGIITKIDEILLIIALWLYKDK